MKTWEVNAELNHRAERRESVIIQANTEQKAIAKGLKAFFKAGYFFVWDIKAREIPSVDNNKNI